MEPATVNALLGFLRGIPAGYNVSFIWHGGEPLLVGRRFFLNALTRITKAANDADVQLRHSVQSNGTLLDAAWIELFVLHDVSVSLSLDGPKDIHDLHRRVGRRGSFDRAMRAISMLRDAGIQPGVLATLTKASLGREEDIFAFFIGERLLSFDILPCFFSGNRSSQPLTIAPDEWATFMIRLFDLWYERDDPAIQIRFFNSVLRGLLGRRPCLCSLDGNCAQFLTIEHDGALYPCDDFAMEERYCAGRLTETSFLECLSSRGFAAFLALRAEALDALKCHGCDFLPVCGGGCSKHLPIGSSVCAARRRLFTHISRRFQQTQRALDHRVPMEAACPVLSPSMRPSIPPRAERCPA